MMPGRPQQAVSPVWEINDTGVWRGVVSLVLVVVGFVSQVFMLGQQLSAMRFVDFVCTCACTLAGRIVCRRIYRYSCTAHMDDEY